MRHHPHFASPRIGVRTHVQRRRHKPEEVRAPGPGLALYIPTSSSNAREGVSAPKPRSHEEGERVSGEEGHSLNIDVPCACAGTLAGSTSIAYAPVLDDDEDGAESEGEGDGEDIHPGPALHLRLQGGFGIVDAPGFLHFISDDIDICTGMRECARSIFISFSTSIFQSTICVHLPISIPIPIPNSSSFEMHKMDKCALASAS
ncbi:hypothetical protein B0H13DRAFT_2378523 [Mycena leptocephala]|nr:hypothetical protein B0H13DRAFT_2378523 [Mycena leptocephala]